MTNDQYGLRNATRRFWLRIVEYTIVIAVVAVAVIMAVWMMLHK